MLISIEYRKYTKGAGGMPFSAHRWPLANTIDANKFRRPWLMSEEEIREYTGLNVYNFWHLVDILRMSGVTDKPTLSLPTLVLMYRLKIYQNLPHGFLSKLMSINKRKVSAYFWLVALVHYANANKAIKMWSDPMTTNIEKDIKYQEMFDNLDPLYKKISSYIEDPLHKNRKGTITYLITTFVFVNRF